MRGPVRLADLILPVCGLALAVCAHSPVSAAEEARWTADPTAWTLPALNGGVISAMAYDDALRQLAVGWSSGEVQLVNPQDGNLIRSLPAQQHRVNALVYLPENRLAAGSDDGTITIWRLADETAPATLTGHTRWVTSLAVSSDGRWLATGSYDRSVRCWDLTSKTSESAVFAGHEGGVKCVDITADGEKLVSAGADRTAMLWNLKTRQLTKKITGHGGAVRAVRFSPDGSQFATAGEDGHVRLWNAETGERQRVLSGHAGMVWSLMYSADGRRLATGGFDQTVRLWTPETGKRLVVFRGPKTPVIGLAFNSDASQLFVASQEPIVRQYLQQSSGENKP